MAILATGKTWANADQVTAALLNQSVNSATFATGIGEATDGTTTEVSSGSIIVKDSGITPAKLSTGGPEWTSGSVVSLGDLSLTNANPEILGGDTDGVMYVAPSTTKDLGGNILLYGDTHASKAKDIEIRATTGVEAHYDDSASKWDFQANAISTSGVITAVGTSLTGTAAGLTSGNVTTNANLTGHVTSVGNAAVLGSFTSLQLKTALSDETGSGAAVFATSPTLVTPALGTPASGVMTNATGTAAGLTAGDVTTNANLTGHVTSVGNAAVLGSFTSAQLKTALTNETGSGAACFAESPTLVTPALGTPSALVATNATGTAAGLIVGATTGVEAGADVTDTANVTAAGALMDSELTDLAGVKGVTISTLQAKPSEGAFADGDKTKLDAIEASADVTDTTNVTSAGALMDSELTSIASVKALNQGVTTTGTPTFAKVTATTGVLFGTDTAVVNTLDDYEEGTWAPVITFGGASTGVVYSTQVGTYTKIGDLVTVTGSFLLSNKGSSTGNAIITGLPFASRSLSGNLTPSSLRIYDISFADFPMGYNNAGLSNIVLQESLNDGTVSSLTEGNFSASSQIQVSLSYRV